MPTYPLHSILIRKTTQPNGELGNFHPDFPLVILGINVRTSEHLYQALRFPGDPNLQQDLLNRPNPLRMKWHSKPFRATHSRADWHQPSPHDPTREVRQLVMRWVLATKLRQHWECLWPVLFVTGSTPIVECKSRRDVWSARPDPQDRPVRYVGENWLGELWMEIRRDCLEGFRNARIANHDGAIAGAVWETSADRADARILPNYPLPPGCSLLGQSL